MTYRVQYVVEGFLRMIAFGAGLSTDMTYRKEDVVEMCEYYLSGRPVSGAGLSSDMTYRIEEVMEDVWIPFSERLLIGLDESCNSDLPGQCLSE